MKLSELDEIHRSPGSWFLGVIYFAPRDPRLLVRKRIGSLGWTLNFARPLAIPFLVASIAALWLGLNAVASTEWSESAKWGAALGMIASLVICWAWVANQRRYID
ncbi:DUF5808 domain-containing protein [Luteolibacter luteus]|uniref:DUF5808 domain-containing protein n=1 Tax=Luteolibacter luteus TaxID=2728835 RepID=A0A858RCA6_9BACT|nr:DUF5808 domain-containing protein [Luteolibacter luteus]QJE94228.1 hypothetical protein HHL09_17785 [Luteolibacter luteus]